MNVLVVGCGKVGSRLANTLCDEGIDVSVIARTAAEADKMLEPQGQSFMRSADRSG